MPIENYISLQIFTVTQFFFIIVKSESHYFALLLLLYIKHTVIQLFFISILILY